MKDRESHNFCNKFSAAMGGVGSRNLAQNVLAISVQKNLYLGFACMHLIRIGDLGTMGRREGL